MRRFLSFNDVHCFLFFLNLFYQGIEFIELLHYLFFTLIFLLFFILIALLFNYGLINRQRESNMVHIRSCLVLNLRYQFVCEETTFAQIFQALFDRNIVNIPQHCLIALSVAFIYYFLQAFAQVDIVIDKEYNDFNYFELLLLGA